jgi:hypothetical protein
MRHAFEITLSRLLSGGGLAAAVIRSTKQTAMPGKNTLEAVVK